MAEPLPPLTRSFEVRCSAEHAFDTWTRRTSLWWPLATHSVSLADAEEVTIEPRVGGRIVERSRDGREHQWGTVTRWEPPRRLGYHWFIHRTQAQASAVEVTFEPLGEARTRVSIVHTGWENSGPDAATFRERNERGWSGVIPEYVKLIERGG